MHVLSYLHLHFLFLSLAAIVSASGEIPLDTRDDISLIQVHGVSQEDVHLLVARQLDLDGIVDGILDFIGPLSNLLRVETIENINLIVSQAADLLGDGGAEDVKGLVDFAGGLLNSDALGGLVGSLGPLLPRLMELLNGDLMTKLTTLLDNAALLLTRDVATQLRDLVNSISPIMEYLMQFIAYLFELLFGGLGGGGGGGGGGDDNPPTGTQTDSPGPGGAATDSPTPDSPGFSFTIPDSPGSTSTDTPGESPDDSGGSGWDFDFGLGSSDDSDDPAQTGTSGSDWDFDFGSGDSSNDDGGGDTGTGTGTGDDSGDPGTETGPDDPGFTGGASRARLGVVASGALGAFVAVLLA